MIIFLIIIIFLLSTIISYVILCGFLSIDRVLENISDTILAIYTRNGMCHMILILSLHVNQHSVFICIMYNHEYLLDCIGYYWQYFLIICDYYVWYTTWLYLVQKALVSITILEFFIYKRIYKVWCNKVIKVQFYLACCRVSLPGHTRGKRNGSGLVNRTAKNRGRDNTTLDNQILCWSSSTQEIEGILFSWTLDGGYKSYSCNKHIL